MTTILTVSWLDSSNEASHASFNLPALAPDGSNWAAILAAAAAVISDLDDATLGVIRQWSLRPTFTRLTNVIPTTGERESKLLVRYQDDVTLGIYKVLIPMYDRDQFSFVAGTDFVDINDVSEAVQVALLAELNGTVLSPNGNAITVISMEKVGRNL